MWVAGVTFGDPQPAEFEEVRAALEAAVNPAEGKALYFVAKGDGSHKFSETLDEHNAAVRRYILNR